MKKSSGWSKKIRASWRRVSSVETACVNTSPAAPRKIELVTRLKHLQYVPNNRALLIQAATTNLETWRKNRSSFVTSLRANSSRCLTSLGDGHVSFITTSLDKGKSKSGKVKSYLGKALRNSKHDHLGLFWRNSRGPQSFYPPLAAICVPRVVVALSRYTRLLCSQELKRL